MRISKPYDKTYTDMAMEFDKEFYTPNRDDSKLYSYVYLLFYMLASKRGFFPYRKDDVEGYAYFASAIIYTRMVRMEKKGVKYKSVLNYIKACLPGTKVQYQNATFDTVLGPNMDKGKFDSYGFYDRFSSEIQSQYNTGMEDELVEVLSDSVRFIKEEVSNSPYGKDPLMCNNLRMSLMLTFLSQITLPNSVIAKLNKELPLGYVKFTRAVSDALLKEAKTPVVLWRLNDKYADYVRILLTRVKERVSEEFKDAKKSFDLSDDTIADIMATAYATYDSREEAE